jgi:hypothetical protein
MSPFTMDLFMCSIRFYNLPKQTEFFKFENGLSQKTTLESMKGLDIYASSKAQLDDYYNLKDKVFSLLKIS